MSNNRHILSSNRNHHNHPHNRPQNNRNRHNHHYNHNRYRRNKYRQFQNYNINHQIDYIHSS